MTDKARWQATVYVGGLSHMATAADVHAAFLPFGEVADVTVPKPEGPNSTEPHRGFGYVEFEDPEDTKAAIDNMDGSELFGKVLKVNAAKPPKNVNEGLGSKTALWEQEGWLAENAVSEEDRLAAERAKSGPEDRPDDPMQGLEGLDVAGPKPA
ncbi:RNA-binding domain-containing protein [Mollisia scopiformis]|uniref:RNA-binding domain-containing protein n=1 Tax=Mollisia scopiformis TaxID=149040 RepID=A0A194XES5_MOLSC|nr:RNA-binding domain-containing protein [Mollisia scopiformis]KUJ18262.1 RNA-binding domain-containing protein [Mollisia scopiformis]